MLNEIHGFIEKDCMKHFPLRTMALGYWIGGVFFFLTASPTWACQFGFNAAHTTVTVEVPRTLSVAKNLPNGTELYRSPPTAISGAGFMTCTYPEPFGYLNNLGSTDASSPSPIGTTGLGWRWVQNGELFTPYPHGVSPGGMVALSGSVGIRIYKIGKVEPSTLSTAIIGTRRGGSLDLFSMRLSNAISITEASCETPSLTVNLGKQRSSQFGAVGSTIGQKAFSIALKNCPTGLTGISYRLDPLTPAVDADQGVLALSKGGATGVGIQITDDKNQVVSLGKTHPFLSTTPVGDYSIPLKAAYYKTANTVNGGIANAAMQFTIIYQ